LPEEIFDESLGPVAVVPLSFWHSDFFDETNASCELFNENERKEREQDTPAETEMAKTKTHKTCSCRDEFCEVCNGDDNNGSLNKDDRKKAAGA
jgi:hypothetical protein